MTGFYQSSLGNELISWTYERFPKQQINRLRNSFADKREVINMASTSSCHRKTFVPFCLRKKIPENAFLTLTVNYRKNCTEKQIMPFNTTLNGILNDM